MSIKTIIQKLKNSEELSKFKYATTQGRIKKAIDKFIQDNKLIITGSKALNAQSSFPYQRAARDTDVFVRNNPKTMVEKLHKILDKIREGDYHYVKPSMHKGTHLLMDVGADLKKGTKDDLNLADFSKIPRKRFSTVEINNMIYAHLDELQKSKERALKFKKFKFRHKKDKADLKVIKKLKGGRFWI